MSDETKSEKAAEKAPAKAEAAKVEPGDFVTHESRPGELGRVIYGYGEDAFDAKGVKTGSVEKAYVTWPKSRVESVHPIAELTVVETPKPKKE